MSSEDRKKKRQKRNEEIAWIPDGKAQDPCAVIALAGLALTAGLAEFVQVFT